MSRDWKAEGTDEDFLLIHGRVGYVSGQEKRTSERSWWCRCISVFVVAVAAAASMCFIKYYGKATPKPPFIYKPIDLMLWNCTTWVVITSILPVTNQVRQLNSLAEIYGWAVVVIGDTTTPASWGYGENLTRTRFFSYSEQISASFPFKLATMLPTKSYSRKAIGYLWAIKMGAQVIYDTDDDNVLLKPLQDVFYLPNEPRYFPASVPVFANAIPITVTNPYAYFGQRAIWPRGYPLEDINSSLPRYLRSQPDRLPFVQQGLVNGDPDVDAIFRITHYQPGKLPAIMFDSSAPPLVLPPGTMAPFNSQNTLWWRDAFHLMFIPTTVAFRACDIWRGYFAQRFLWSEGGVLSFMPPTAFQLRTPHDYVDDLKGEMGVYKNTAALIQLLLRHNLSSSAVSTSRAVIEVATAISKEGLWGATEIDLLQAWLDDLQALGLDTISKPVDWQSRQSMNPDTVANSQCCFTPQALTPAFKNQSRVVLTASGLPVRRGRYMYLAQGQSAPPAWLQRVALRDDADAVFAYFNMTSATTVFWKGSVKMISAKNTTWTGGRNLLYKEALRMQTTHGWAYEYLIFADEDAELDFASKLTGLAVPVDPYSAFHISLSTIHPAVAAVFLPDFNHLYLNKCGPVTPCTTTIDAMFNAIHATVAPMVLPYSTVFDKLSWYASQWVLTVMLTSSSLSDYVRQFNQFHIKPEKAQHHGYGLHGGNFALAKRNGTLSPIEAYIKVNSPACMNVTLPWKAAATFEDYQPLCHQCRQASMLQDYSSLLCKPMPINATFNTTAAAYLFPPLIESMWQS